MVHYGNGFVDLWLPEMPASEVSLGQTMHRKSASPDHCSALFVPRRLRSTPGRGTERAWAGAMFGVSLAVWVRLVPA